MKAETESSSAPNPEEPPKTSRIPRWVGVIAAVALIVGIIGVILFYGYQARPGWVGAADKKFWDYLELLIVPAALAIGVYLLNRAQSEREREAEEAQQERERRAEEARRERELEVENQRSQDEALQAYLDQMSQLLTDKEQPLHRSQVGDRLSSLARARTLTVLPRLDSYRKARVVQFLHEAGLITQGRAVLALRGADLSGADLSGADLSGADLRSTDLHLANLQGADLRSTDLSRTDLSGAILSGTKLIRANLREAILGSTDLSHADLRGADLRGVLSTDVDLRGAHLNYADLREVFLPAADLSGADLREANMSGANLNLADLREADLRGAEGITNEELERQASSLEGATMPNGQKYEDWLKSKGCGEDGENSGPL